jgi:hypothetical protein
MVADSAHPSSGSAASSSSSKEQQQQQQQQPVLVASQRVQGELLSNFDAPLARKLESLDLSPQVPG